jgi:MOSC domain-containing protein YiiM
MPRFAWNTRRAETTVARSPHEQAEHGRKLLDLARPMPLDPSSSLARLFNAPVRPGVVAWIGLRPARRTAMTEVGEARLEAGSGLAGDHYGRRDGNRQVTLVAAESLRSIGSHLGREAVAAGDLRRNIVTRGINLIALKGRRFRIGEAILETTGECHPCSRMEETFGAGGYNAVRGLGGITARVVEGGRVRIGDAIEPLDAPDALAGRS